MSAENIFSLDIRGKSSSYFSGKQELLCFTATGILPVAIWLVQNLMFSLEVSLTAWLTGLSHHGVEFAYVTMQS